MIFTKDYKIDLWSKWNEFVSAAIDDFIITFNHRPEILIANVHTHSQIDFIVNIKPDDRKKVLKENTETGEIIRPAREDDIVIDEFTYADCELTFCVNDELEDKYFRLVYDDDNEFETENPIISDRPSILQPLTI